MLVWLLGLVFLAILLYIAKWLWNNWHKYFGTDNRHKWFAEFFKEFPIFYNEKTFGEKVKLFEELNTIKRKNGKDLKLLEIGVGPGANLQFYPENIKLTALDPNPYFQQILKTNLKKYPNVELEKFIVSGAEKMMMKNEKGEIVPVPDNSFDCVVSTMVLCSCDKVKHVYEEVCRVLVPGGTFFYMEHVIDDQSHSILKILQRLAGGLGIFPFLVDGCRPDKDLARDLNKAGFKSVDLKRFRLDFSDGAPAWALHLIVPHIYGFATAP